MCYNRHRLTYLELLTSKAQRQMTNAMTITQAEAELDSGSGELSRKAKRQAERRRSDMAASLLPIAEKQSKLIAQQSGVPFSDLYGEAQLAIAIAMQKGDWERPGFHRYVKLCVKGYLYNYLRDKCRPVRLPRDLTATYLTEQRLSKEEGWAQLSDEQKADAVGCSVEHLRESRSAIAISPRQLDYHDGDPQKLDSLVSDLDLTSDLARHRQDFDLTSAVFKLGVDQLAKLTRQDSQEVELKFYAELKLLIDRAKSDEY